MDRIPCRASADLRQHQADQDAADCVTPNFAAEDDLREVVVDSLVEPLAALFTTRDQIRQLQRSDGFKDAINHVKAVEWLMHDLVGLEQALRRRWESS